MKKSNSKTALIILAVLGLAALYGSFCLYSSTQKFIAKAKIVQGVVVNLISVSSDDGHTYKPEVEFKLPSGQSQRFTSSVSSDPPAFSRGEKVEVLYDPNNPEEAKIKAFFSLYLGCLILGIFGAIFLAIPVLVYFFSIRRQKLIQQLKSTGQKVSTKIISIDQNLNFKINGQSPWVIQCQWHDPATNAPQIFKSDNIWYNPKDYIKEENIDVFIEPSNLKKYYVDLSKLPQ